MKEKEKLNNTMNCREVTFDQVEPLFVRYSIIPDLDEHWPDVAYHYGWKTCEVKNHKRRYKDSVPEQAEYFCHWLQDQAKPISNVIESFFALAEKAPTKEKQTALNNVALKLVEKYGTTNTTESVDNDETPHPPSDEEPEPTPAISTVPQSFSSSTWVAPAPYSSSTSTWVAPSPYSSSTSTWVAPSPYSSPFPSIASSGVETALLPEPIIQTLDQVDSKTLDKWGLKMAGDWVNVSYRYGLNHYQVGEYEEKYHTNAERAKRFLYYLHKRKVAVKELMQIVKEEHGASLAIDIGNYGKD